MGGSSANGGGFQSRRRGSKRYAPMADMNVTPLVDVMLVLLIVFMVTAPFMTTGVPIDLPKTEAKALGGDKEPLTIVVDKEGAIFIQDKEIDPKNLIAKLKAIALNGYNERIYVRGDTRSSYGAVIGVMGKISGAGFSRIGLVTQQEEGG